MSYEAFVDPPELIATRDATRMPSGLVTMRMSIPLCMKIGALYGAHVAPMFPLFEGTEDYALEGTMNDLDTVGDVE